MPRPQTEARLKATRTALFILESAISSGFKFRARGPGKLEILGPAGVDPAACEPVVAAIRDVHGAEILRLLRLFDAEADQGRIWSPRPEARTPQ